MSTAMPFHVFENVEFRIGRHLIARYLVGNTYRLTNKNQEFVADLIQQNKAAFGQVSGAAAQVALRASGRITVK